MNTEMKINGEIYISYHKQFPLINEKFLKPIHVGRACVNLTKDGSLSENDTDWLTSNMIGDNVGDNISKRNREYCECTGLYWIWKNVDYSNYKYIGYFQYRRQLILNDYFLDSKNNKEKEVYQCIHFKKKDRNISDIIGLKENTICNLMNKYDCIIPHPAKLDKMNINSIYEDWVERIPGVHVDDLIILEKFFEEKLPHMAKELNEYLNKPNKIMYHIFIVRPKIFNEYCSWLFKILFEIDKLIDSHLYTVNGKRTIGYLAEILYGFYFTMLLRNKKYNVLQCGVTYLE